MRTMILGSFVGFVLAVAFLAACGSSGDPATGAGPAPVSTPSAAKWSALGPRTGIATGLTLARDQVWSSTSSLDNAAAGVRHQYAAFEITGNFESFAAGDVSVDVGVLPSIDGTNYATEPQWLATLPMSIGSNRRGVVANVRIPPTRMRFALRVRYASSMSARVTAFAVTPYDEELQ